MAASVLFDAPGPKALARHRLYGIISGLILLGIFGLMMWQFQRKGQLAAEFWEPFVTPRIINVIVEGVARTLLAAVIAIAGALVYGLIFGSGKLSDHRAVRWPSWFLVEFFRAVPLLMIIIATWYLIGPQPGAKGFTALIIGLILYNGSVLAEIFRAGIYAVPKGQSEAAYAIGMGKGQVMRIVLLPQAIKIMLPAIISQTIVALKDTSLGYAVLAPGLTVAGKLVYGEFRNTLQTVFVLALIYIFFNVILSWFGTWTQKRFAGEKKIELTAVGVLSDRDTGATQSAF